MGRVCLLVTTQPSNFGIRWDVVSLISRSTLIFTGICFILRQLPKTQFHKYMTKRKVAQSNNETMTYLELVICPDVEYHCFP